MKTKLSAGQIITAGSLPHEEVITFSEDYTKKILEESDKNIYNDKIKSIQELLGDYREDCHIEADKNNHASSVKDEYIDGLIDFLKGFLIK